MPGVAQKQALEAQEKVNHQVNRTFAPTTEAKSSPLPAWGMLQRKCACGNHTPDGGTCESCSAQRGAGQDRHSEIPPIVHDTLRSSGHPLDRSARAFMEPRFGHDFSRVRVHTDARAGESTRALDALAYTVGHDVVMGAGQYAPETAHGRRLLAHELAHVVQQEAGATAVQTLPMMPGPGDRFEQEADRMADDALGWKRRPGGSLPYREATEYSKCLTIMGDENAAYCREAVLGEKSKPDCDPAAVRDPLADMSTFQSPGASGWWGAKFGCYRNACGRRHRGWDIHAPPGTPILAAATGTVTRHNDPGGLGEFIRLRSDADANRVYLYAHLSARHPAGHYCVGDTIGQTGTTGNASADRPHLHLQVHISGTVVDPIGHFAEPTQVVEATGSVAAAIDKTLPEPCAPCAM